MHIQTHGEVRPGPGSGGTGGLATLEVVPGSPFHCGMLGAAGLSVELERFVLRARPAVLVRGLGETRLGLAARAEAISCSRRR